jgi:rubrerythrin
VVCSEAQGIEAALGVIRCAVQNEIAGQRFYADASRSCIDPWAKETFAILAGEEQVHTRLLLLEHKALAAGGEWLDPQVALAGGMEVDITQIAFSDEDCGDALFPTEQAAAEIVDRRASDLDALIFGISLEKSAIELYTRAGAAVADAAARKAYRFLVDEETRHYQQLRTQWERLAGIGLPA